MNKPNVYKPNVYLKRLIYVFTINDEKHKDLVKIGQSSLKSSKENLEANSLALNRQAHFRIKQICGTAGDDYNLLHTELAEYSDGTLFTDNDVHNVLKRSGIKNVILGKAREWYKCTEEDAVKAIKAVKKKISTIDGVAYNESMSPIIFREEQLKAIKDTVNRFKKYDNYLWNAKMRFGKTLCALEVVKECRYEKTLILTHRPVVKNGWFDDFEKIFYDTNYKKGSKTLGNTIEELLNNKDPFVYFASMQDLRGSSAVEGKFDKNNEIFDTEWDLLIIDEAHEGTQTELGKTVIESIKKKKILELSGTPFNIIDNFDANEVFTWDYIMEQEAKQNWSREHEDDSNPYEDLPKLNIYTYDLGKLVDSPEIEGKSFNFAEFFRVKKDAFDNDTDEFLHESSVKNFLDILCKEGDTNYPFSTEEYKDMFRHTLWRVPGVASAKALSKLLKNHSVFGNGAFEICNVAGAGDEEQPYNDALETVKETIKKAEENNAYSITLSCGKLTTGVTVPEWTACLMLSGSVNTNAANYLQTIFRVTSTYNKNGRFKSEAYVFDFAPDRTLQMLVDSVTKTSGGGNTDADKAKVGKLLNYLPVLGYDGTLMKEYSVNYMYQELKKVYIERAVNTGFDSADLYNDNLLKLNEMDVKEFEGLKKIIGKTDKQVNKIKITVNDQGLDEEEKEKTDSGKHKRELTEEEKERIKKLKEARENKKNAIKILRGISIRLPLLVYGMEGKVKKKIKISDMRDIDPVSWEEFMPAGVTKEIFEKFEKYYDEDIFQGAVEKIRKLSFEADKLDVEERVREIGNLFLKFRNPDKETVLTPWRVVNMHLCDCLGGYNFFDKEYKDIITANKPKFYDREQVTKDVFSGDSKILEINSKTGLYPLYMAYSIFAGKKKDYNKSKPEMTEAEIWKEVVENNIYAICKTPMAKKITDRTLRGYKNYKTNTRYYEDIITVMKERPELFVNIVGHTDFWKKEEYSTGGKSLKFSAVVGNPPYQLNVGNTSGNASKSKAIYHYFLDNAINLNPEYISLIMPSRWMTKSTEGISDEWVDKIINCNYIKIMHDYLSANDIFPGVEIKGGICYFLYCNNYIGKCNYILHNIDGSYATNIDYLNSNKADVVIRDLNAIEIIHKIQNIDKDYIKDENKNFYGIVSPKDFFTNKVQLTSSWKDYVDNKDKIHNIKLYINKQIHNKEYGFISKNDIPKNHNTINLHKVYIPAAGGSGTDSIVLGNPFYGEPNSVCSQTYLVIGYDKDRHNLSKEECLNIIKYIKTRFFRYLVSVKKKTQNGPRMVYQFVPMQDFTDKSDIDWSQSVSDIDQQLYNKYNFSEEEREYIEKSIDYMK